MDQSTTKPKHTHQAGNTCSEVGNRIDLQNLWILLDKVKFEKMVTCDLE